MGESDIRLQLRRRREALGLTQAEAAKRSGISKRSIWASDNLERWLLMHDMECYARALGLTLALAEPDWDE